MKFMSHCQCHQHWVHYIIHVVSIIFIFVHICMICLFPITLFHIVFILQKAAVCIAAVLVYDCTCLVHIRCCVCWYSFLVVTKEPQLCHSFCDIP